MLAIHLGENAIIKRSLTQSDGSPLLVSNINSAEVQAIQAGQVLKTWTYASSSFSSGFSSSGASELEVQIESSLVKAAGLVQLRWVLKYTNASFTVDGGMQVSVFVEDALLVQ
jgi:hypothetical protein